MGLLLPVILDGTPIFDKGGVPDSCFQNLVTVRTLSLLYMLAFDLCNDSCQTVLVWKWLQVRPVSLYAESRGKVPYY